MSEISDNHYLQKDARTYSEKNKALPDIIQNQTTRTTNVNKYENCISKKFKN